MKIHRNQSLKHYHTFQTDAIADELIIFETEREIIDFIRRNGPGGRKILVLGEGSNLLFSQDFKGLVLKIDTKGIELVSEDHDQVTLKAQAGENWDDFVAYCVERNWGGLENLSFIPGNVGTSPIQNIGAYGVEMREYFHKLEALDISTGEVRVFSGDECRFSYRNSIFKEEARGRFIILTVSFHLDKNPVPILRYQRLKEELAGKSPVLIKEVRDAVIRIRQGKLPDPAEIGNAGSFFKNPVISNDKLAELQKSYRDMPFFPVDGQTFKIPAAWLIETCGWRGKRYGDAGVYDRQALVLVNYGRATGKEILELAEGIKDSVHERFGIKLEEEVNII